MAERRMFAKTIIDSDAFIDMPLSSQALYFHLSMRADDEGFINNPKKIQRMIGASDDDIKMLVAKKFIIPFESGIVVIKHWRIHNYIRGDRLKETVYSEERQMLGVKDNGSYTLNEDLNEIENLSSNDMRKIAYKESSLPYSFTYKIKRAFFGKECPVCNNTMKDEYLCKPTIQHNIPISKGGKHELENISVICESCNCSIRDNATSELNNKEVAEIWDKIVYAEKHNIDWFYKPEILENIDCQSSDSQPTDKCQSNVSIGKDRLGKDRLGKDRLGKDSIESSDELKPPKPTKHKYGEYNNVLLSDEDMTKLQTEFPNDYQIRIDKLSSYIASTGKSYKNHLATIRNWARMDKERNQSKPQINKTAQQLDESYKMMSNWAEEEEDL